MLFEWISNWKRRPTTVLSSNSSCYINDGTRRGAFSIPPPTLKMLKNLTNSLQTEQ